MKLNPYFGEFGGMYVPQILVPALIELEDAFLKNKNNPIFQKEFKQLLNNYAGRPTPLTLCRNITVNTASKLYLKREDLLHGGAHKTNQVLGQALLAKKIGKTDIIAETGAGQHGVASAIASSLLNLKCRIYMGTKDIRRQATNVLRMKLLGATVIPVNIGSKTLKDACNEALRDWSNSYNNAHYMLGTVAGPHPYPTIVKEFQSIIGKEAYNQIKKQEQCLPNIIIACIGGGSNAIGIFSKFINQTSVQLVGVEAGGLGGQTNHHGAAIQHGKLGIYFGMKSYVIQSDDGQIQKSHSIASGLDFPAIGPEHAYLNKIGRVKYVSVNDEEALHAFNILARHEGILPALESSHALAYALKIIRKEPQKKQIIVVNLSGRGDKDINTVYNNTLEKEGDI